MKIPSYRHHRPSGQAVTTIEGRDLYLGKFNTPESRDRYRKVIATYLLNTGGPPVASDRPTIAEVVNAFLADAEQTIKPRRSGRLVLMRLARSLAIVVKLFGNGLADSFGPRELIAARREMGRLGWCRTEANRCVTSIRRCWRWGVVYGMISAVHLEALRAVPPMRRGELGFVESKRRHIPRLCDVVAAGRHMPPDVRAFCLLLYWCGARPSELTRLHAEDLQPVAKGVKKLVLTEHKTDWRDKAGDRVILIGPRGWAAIAPLLRLRPTGPVFRMGQNRRNERDYNRTLRLIREACDAAGIQRFTPYAFRHGAATRWEEAGLNDGQIRRLLGHVAGGALGTYGHAGPDVQAIRRVG